jgi:MraZ protein
MEHYGVRWVDLDRIRRNAINLENSGRMAENALNAAILYNGEFTFGVENRRTQVPSKWLPEKYDPKVSAVEFSVIVWAKSVHGICLRVMTREKMDELIAQLNAMPSSDPRKGKLKRMIGRDSAQVLVDKQGRILLPEGMAQTAGITDRAVFVGLLDRFEIWSPERNAAQRAAESAEALDVFSMLE